MMFSEFGFGKTFNINPEFLGSFSPKKRPQLIAPRQGLNLVLKSEMVMVSIT